MRPEQQLVLDTIAEGEAPDYQTIYGGHKFKSFASHPGIAIPIGNTGFKSTAAGRYQLLQKTWEDEAKRLGLKDFKPESQDAAAWDLAQRTYSQQTGRDLEADAAAKQVQWGALVRQWPSLQRFAKPEAAPGASGIGASALPDITPEIFSQLQPGTVASPPLLTPVDHDPFQRTANK